MNKIDHVKAMLSTLVSSVFSQLYVYKTQKIDITNKVYCASIEKQKCVLNVWNLLMKTAFAIPV
jgi:hypothetical protein